MSQTKRKYSTRVGTRVGTHKDKTRTRMVQRSKDRRVQESLADVRDQQRRLAARMAAEEAEAARHDAELQADRARQNAAKRELWPLADARHLIRQGYTLTGTVARTGWPVAMLSDVIPGEW